MQWVNPGSLLAMAALLGVLSVGTLAGVFIGVLLSLLWLIWRVSHPAIPVLGRMPDSKSFHSIEQHPEALITPGVVVLRFDGPLFFATASSLRNRVLQLTRHAEPPVQAVVLDLESTDLIDLEGSDELQKVAQELKEQGIGLYLARVKDGMQRIMAQDGVYEHIPSGHFFTSVELAVEAASQPDGAAA